MFYIIKFIVMLYQFSCKITIIIVSTDVIMQTSNIILGVTGGIAAYKSIDLARQLVKCGHSVQVVLTESASEFVTELTFQAITGKQVRTKLFDTQAELGMGHIELARWADVMIIAPATANCVASLAHGMAYDLLSTLCLALDTSSNADKKIYLAPAMNKHMWHHPLTQENIQRLEKLPNYLIIAPEAGEQACGDVGYGRMASVESILATLNIGNQETDTLKISELSLSSPIRGSTLSDSEGGESREVMPLNKKILITAGPTKEAIDPVRFISNHSSGKMGYSIANVASKFGYEVTLISGPVSQQLQQQLDSKINLINIITANDMLAQVKEHIAEQDVFIGVAAVADYKPAAVSKRKIKKNSVELELKLIKNPDIIKYVGEYKQNTNNDLVVVGFAAESDNLKMNAYDKLQAKNLDFIVLNDITKQDIAFNSNDNEVSILFRDGNVMNIAKQSKMLLAEQIIQLINELILRETNESRCESIG